MEYVHKSVLLNEAIENLNIKEDGIYVDATLGGGGHSSVILSKLKTGHLYAFDQDDYAIKRSTERLSKISNNYTIIKSNFVNLKEELEKLGVTKIDGILYDLGVSSFQFDIPDRGFSYNYDAKLDMRMNQDQELTAEFVVNNYKYEDLVKILYKYSEEAYAKQIARNIEQSRKKKRSETTFELVDVIKSALPQKVLNSKGHPAKKTFQALRIEVNDELKVFEKSLYQAIDLLNSDGKIVVISFHSLEDRIAKEIFREVTTVNAPKNLPVMPKEADFELVNKHVITSSEEELKENNRAHSAKMRVLRKK